MSITINGLQLEKITLTVSGVQAGLLGTIEVYGEPPSIGRNIVGVGNSLMAGQGAVAGMTMTKHLSDMLTDAGYTHTMTNLGVGGQTTEQMEATAVQNIDSLLVQGVENILLVQEMRNDMIQNSLTPQQAYDNMVSFCNNRKDAGWNRIINCAIPTTWDDNYKGQPNLSGYQLLDSDRLEVNAKVALNAEGAFDRTVTLENNIGLNTLHKNEQAGYVYDPLVRPTTSANLKWVDGTHMTSDGYFRMAELYYVEVIN